MNLRVLIVDDDEIFLMLHSTWVVRSGLSTDPKTFNDCREVYKFLHEHHDSPDHYLLLLDVNMPVMSGWDLINKLKEADIHNKMSVIMVTSSFDPEDRKKADSYDCIIDYIEKPLDIDLCNRIKLNEAISRFFN